MLVIFILLLQASCSVGRVPTSKEVYGSSGSHPDKDKDAVLKVERTILINGTEKINDGSSVAVNPGEMVQIQYTLFIENDTTIRQGYMVDEMPKCLSVSYLPYNAKYADGELYVSFRAIKKNTPWMVPCRFTFSGGPEYNQSLPIRFSNISVNYTDKYGNDSNSGIIHKSDFVFYNILNWSKLDAGRELNKNFIIGLEFVNFEHVFG